MGTIRGRGDELYIIRKILSFGVSKEYYGILAVCLACAIAVLELQIIIAAILIYNKNGTWKALTPYFTIATLIQPACAGMLILITILPKLENMLDTITENSRELVYLDKLFETGVKKDVKNIKILSAAIIIISFTAHLIFAMPSVFNDYDIHMIYWLTREYCEAPLTAIMSWISSASLLIGSFSVAYPLIFFAYFKFHICLQLRWIATYLEQRFTITAKHESYNIQNKAYHDMVSTELKSAIKYSLIVEKSFKLLLDIQNFWMLLISPSGMIAGAGIIYFIAIDIRPDTNYRIFYALFEVVVMEVSFGSFGQNIYDESTKLEDVLYHSPWIYWNQKNKKALLLILLFRKGLVLSFFNLVDVNHEVLITHCRVLYSIVAVVVNYK
uniref:Odorant receptor n=1 Tax=Diabrotica virgifera virgifera TaxID=50390 RepID=A0A6P7FCR5_DIAVI